MAAFHRKAHSSIRVVHPGAYVIVGDVLEGLHQQAIGLLEVFEHMERAHSGRLSSRPSGQGYFIWEKDRQTGWEEDAF